LLKAVAQSVPYQGKIILSGNDACKMNTRKMAKMLAVLEQTHSVGYSFTVEELVNLGRYAHQTAFSHADPEGARKVEHALELCGLIELRKQNVMTLSGGELQRAFLAQVFAQDAPLLLLDEPVSHLDLAYQQDIFELISKWLEFPGRAVLSVVHDLQLARRYGTHVFLMKQGKCVSYGETDDVFTQNNLYQAFGIDVNTWFDWLYAPWLDGQNKADSI
jgi:iron complex transport system ATP-binding protein